MKSLKSSIQNCKKRQEEIRRHRQKSHLPLQSTYNIHNQEGQKDYK